MVLCKSDVCKSKLAVRECIRMYIPEQWHPYRSCISSAFENRWYRYKARAQINRRHGQECTSLYILDLRVCPANTLLIRTTAVLGGKDTLGIFSSGTDAAGSIRSEFRAYAKLAIKSVHGCTLLMMQRSRCAIYFQKRTSKDSNPRYCAAVTVKFEIYARG